SLAIPEKEERRPFIGGLSKLLEVGYVENVVKLDYNSLYPSIMLTYNLSSAVDIQGVILRFLEYILTARETYKNRKLSALKNGDDKDATRNDILQRTLKKLDNSVYGALASGEPFPWADITVAERTSCIGRIMMRILFSHFTQIGYKPILGDTDGINFQLPDKFLYTDEEPYISGGEGRNSIKGQAYVGIWADVCEFEDLYLNKAYNGGINKMGLGVDAFYKTTINIRRKVYANLLHDGTVKLVGSSIKSREMPLYVSRFFDEAIPLLLNKRTADFATLYYDYVERIYNLQMPPMDLATKVVIKTPIESYKKACENNSNKPRKAIYELIIRDNIDVNVGDAVCYINVGKGGNDGDLNRITHYYTLDDKGNKEFYYLNSDSQRVLNNGVPLTIDDYLSLQYKKYKEKNSKSKEYSNLNNFVKKNFPYYKEDPQLDLNCAIIKDNSFIPYNADIYINLLNKKIKPLLSCFKRSIRSAKESDDGDNILVPNPHGRRAFANNDLPLSFGSPIDLSAQDSYEKFMKFDDKEIELWLNLNETPPYISGEDWLKIVEDFRWNQKS
ncbi:MAG: hypothetical protein LUD72_04095, partial [Bacteroidales bacterium]|nr:hypothetical protein [Bacteroidales bacterium]